jgi:hypothetical protein
MMRTYHLTPYQVDEVRGLLDVCADEAKTSGDRTPWGEVQYWRRGKWLLVVRDLAADAVDDLRHRADYLVDEGARAGAGPLAGMAGARSLRSLADRIEHDMRK